MKHSLTFNRKRVLSYATCPGCGCRTILISPCQDDLDAGHKPESVCFFCFEPLVKEKELRTTRCYGCNDVTGCLPVTHEYDGTQYHCESCYLAVSQGLFCRLDPKWIALRDIIVAQASISYSYPS